MPQSTITISDDNDTAYELLISFDVTPAEPDVGIMWAGHEITDVKCTEIRYHCGAEKQSVLPGAINPKAEDWFGKWCLELFEKQIENVLAETPVEIDYPEYE